MTSPSVSTPSIDCESMRSVHKEMCKVLGFSEETMTSFSTGLFSAEIITREEKKAVLDKCGSKGADALLDLVGMKIEMGYKRLDRALGVIEEEENLKHFDEKIKTKRRVLMEETDRMETGSSSSESEILDDDGGMQNIQSNAQKLVEEFDDLVAVIEAKISTVNTGQLIVRLNLYISREKTDRCVRKLFVKLRSFTTPQDVLNYLILEHFIGYLNYELLKVFQKLIGNQTEVDEVIAKFTQYEASLKVFFRQTSLSTIADLFQQHPEFVPRSLVGLPKFTVTLNIKWKGKNVYQWRDLLEKRFSWSSGIQITKMKRKCIVIEYSVLPFFAPAVVRDLTDPLVLVVLKRQGVTVELSQELMKSSQPDGSTYTPLHLAAKSGETDTVEMILKLGADVNIEDEFGHTPIHLAAEYGETDTVETLVKLGANVQKVNRSGYTSLHLAAKSGKTDTVETLVKLGASIQEVNRRGYTPLHLAAESGKTDTVVTLAKLGADINEEDESAYTAMHLAAESGKTDTVEALVKLGANIHKQNLFGYTPLHLAAKSGKTDTVENLVKLGAKIHEEDKRGYTSLHVAAKSGKTDTVEILVKLGADIHKVEKRGYTSLHLAAESGKTDTVEALVKLGANVHMKDRFGYTPLNLATVSDTVEALFKHGTDIHIGDTHGYASIHLAAKSGKTDAVETLVKLGADIHKEDRRGCTPFHLAAESGKTDTVETLVKLGANIHKEDRRGCTPLHLAAESGKTDTVVTLVKLGANIHKEDRRGCTPLHLAAESGKTDTVETLIKLGANIHKEDRYGCTPLHLAAESDETDSVETLIKHGADFHKKDWKLLRYSQDYQQKYEKFCEELNPSVIEFQKETSVIIRDPPKFELTVSRSKVMEDSFNPISRAKPSQLKDHLWINFTGESGQDCGGLTREWFQLISHEMFHPCYGLFEYSASNNYILQINPESDKYIENHLEYFHFIGRVCGMAIYHKNQIDGYFIRPFYKMILGQKITLKDMESVDIKLYESLKAITLDPESLDLTFAQNKTVLGEVLEEELKPGGAQIQVTEDNKAEYIDLLMAWRFTKRVESQMAAFCDGLSDVVPSNLLRVFDAEELEYLLGGIAQIDVNDWKRNTELNGYLPTDWVMIWFWQVIENFDDEMRARLLQFVTGTSKVPMNGFAELQGSGGTQKFCVRKFGKPNEFPRAHTCFNRIDLPPYPDYQTLKKHLIDAIENTIGFYGVD